MVDINLTVKQQQDKLAQDLERNFKEGQKIQIGNQVIKNTAFNRQRIKTGGFSGLITRLVKENIAKDFEKQVSIALVKGQIIPERGQSFQEIVAKAKAGTIRTPKFSPNIQDILQKDTATKIVVGLKQLTGGKELKSILTGRFDPKTKTVIGVEKVLQVGPTPGKREQIAKFIGDLAGKSTLFKKKDVELAVGGLLGTKTILTSNIKKLSAPQIIAIAGGEAVQTILLAKAIGTGIRGAKSIAKRFTKTATLTQALAPKTITISQGKISNTISQADIIFSRTVKFTDRIKIFVGKGTVLSTTKKGRTRSSVLIQGFELVFGSNGKVIATNPILSTGEILTTKQLKSIGVSQTLYKNSIKKLFSTSSTKRLFNALSKRKLTKREVDVLEKLLEENKNSPIFQLIRNDLRVNPSAFGIRGNKVIKGLIEKGEFAKTVTITTNEKEFKKQILKQFGKVKNALVRTVNKKNTRTLRLELKSIKIPKVDINKFSLKESNKLVKQVSLSKSININLKYTDLVKDFIIISETKTGQIRLIPKGVQSSLLKKAGFKKVSANAFKSGVQTAIKTKSKLGTKANTQISNAVLDSFGIASQGISKQLSKDVIQPISKAVTIPLASGVSAKVKSKATSSIVGGINRRLSVPRIKTLTFTGVNSISGFEIGVRGRVRQSELVENIQVIKAQTRQAKKPGQKTTPKAGEIVSNIQNITPDIGVRSQRRIKTSTQIKIKSKIDTRAKITPITSILINSTIIRIRPGLPFILPFKGKKKVIKDVKKRKDVKKGRTQKKPTNRLIEQVVIEGDKKGLFKEDKKTKKRKKKKTKKKKGGKKKHGKKKKK